jgi:amino acid transporter
VISVTGILYAAFYVLTALATFVYFRRRVASNFWSALVLGILPLLSAAFLVWLMERAIQTQSTPTENWTIVVIIGLGLILMLVARFGLKSAFFKIPRESDAG